VWIDVNSGVKMNDTMVGNLMYSSVFYGVPDGGVGKDTPRWVVGVAGSFTITNWLNDAKNGVDSVDFAWIGDSNIISEPTTPTASQLPQGFADGILWAGISAGMRMYGSPVVPVGGNQGNNSSPNNKVGYNVYHQGLRINFNRGWTSGVLYGPSEFATGFSAGSGQFTPLGGSGGLTDFNQTGYAWLGSGATGYGGSQVSNWILGNTGGKTGIDSTNIVLRIIAGTTGNVGGVAPIWVVNQAGTAVRVKDVTFGSTGAGFTAYGITFPSYSMGNTAIEISYTGYFSGTNGLATGPIGMAMSSIYNPGVKGIASSTFHECAGASLGQMWTAITQAGISGGNDLTINYLKEYYNRQVAAGGTGRLCIALLGGINFDNGATTSDKATNSINNIKNIITFITSEWSRAGLSANKLTFLVLNEWEQPADGGYVAWNTIYSLINQNIKEWAKTTNVTYVDIFKLGGDFAGLTANNYYSSGGLTQHLNSEGYRVLTNNIMTALLKQRNTNRYS